MPALWHGRKPILLLQFGAHLCNHRAMQIKPDIVAAIRRITNKTDFCERYEIPIRTLYNLLEAEHSANRATIMLVTMALQAEGLLAVPKKKAALR